MELTADAAVMTSEGEDAPPVWGGGEVMGWVLVSILLLPHLQVHHGLGVGGQRRRCEKDGTWAPHLEGTQMFRQMRLPPVVECDAPSVEQKHLMKYVIF